MDTLRTLSRLDHGELLDSLVAYLNDAAADAQECGGSSVVTLKVKVKATGRSAVEPIQFETELSRTIPKKSGGKTFLYRVDDELRTAPKSQAEMDLRVVEDAGRDIRETATGAPVVREA